MKIEEYVKLRSISMNHFLKNYCGISSEMDFSNAVHKNITDDELKEIDPNIGHIIKRYSKDYAMGNIDKIEKGEILIVKDALNNWAPYNNPLHLKEEQLLEKLSDKELLIRELERVKKEFYLTECGDFKLNKHKKKRRVRNYG